MEERVLARAEKNATRRRQTIAFLDESGFYLLCSVIRTWAPVGRRPILRARLRRKHLSIICALTLKGRLYVGMQPRAYKAADVVRFLRHLLVRITGKLIVIWDGTNIHRGAEIDAFLASTEGQRIELEALPGYAPELNPAEGIWGYLKQVELRNVRCENLSDLRTTVQRAVRRLQRKRRILLAIVRHVYPV